MGLCGYVLLIDSKLEQAHIRPVLGKHVAVYRVIGQRTEGRGQGRKLRPEARGHKIRENVVLLVLNSTSSHTD